MSRFANSRLPAPSSLPHPPRSQSPPVAQPCPNKMDVLDNSWYVSCIDHIGPNPEGTNEISEGGHFGADEGSGDGATSRRNTWTVEDHHPLELDLIADQSMPVLSADEVSSADDEVTCPDASEVMTSSPPVVTTRVGRSGTFRTFRPEGARPPGPDIARGEDEGGETCPPPPGGDVIESPPPELAEQPRPLPPLETPCDPAPNFVPKKSKHSAMMERLAASIAKDRTKPKKEVKSKLNQTSLNATLVQPDKIGGKITFLKKLSSFDGGNRFAFTKKTTQNPSNCTLGNGDLYSNGSINGSKLNSRRESFASSLTSSSISESKPKPRYVAQPVPAKTAHKAHTLKTSKDSTLNHTLTNGKIPVASFPKSKPNGTLTRTTDYSTVQSKIKSNMVTRSRPVRQKVTQDCPKMLQLRRHMNTVMVGIQALAIVVDHQIERETKNSLWHRRAMEKLQSRAQSEFDEAQRKNEKHMADQMALFDTKLKYLERVKANEMIELQNRMNQEREKLVENHELALKSVQDDCQRALLDKETAHQVEKSLLKAESLKLSEEYENLKEKYQRTELALTRSAEKKLELARSTYQTQRAEIESLTAVLEMKNGEIHKLRAHNLSLERKCEELNETREELERLKMKTEELQAIIDNKAHCEQVLSEEKVQLRHAYEKESKVNQRLSLELEEMAWKLKQNKTSKRSSTSSIPPNTASNSCMSRSVESSPFNKHSTPYKIHRANNEESLTSQSLILDDSGDHNELDNSYFPIVHMYVGKQSFNNVPPMRQKYNCDNCHQDPSPPRPAVPFDPDSADSEELSTLTENISPYKQPHPQTSLDVVNH